jgi:hypothetical protein
VKQLKINNKVVAMIPTSWKDLTPDQVQAICKLSLLSLNETYMKVQLFLIITGLELMRHPPIHVGVYQESQYLYKMRSKRTGVIFVDTVDINFVVSQFNFLFTRIKGHTVIESKIAENHFPYLRNSWGRKLYGPESALFNITLDEFIRAETLYSQFGSTPDPVLINKFCATLYRPRNKKAKPNSPEFSGDVRQVFNDHLIDSNARHTKHLYLWQKIYIRMFYEGCRAFIIHKHPDAFSSDGDPGAQPKTVFEGFIYLVAALSDNDATRAARLRKTLLWDILPQLESLSAQMKAIKNKNSKYPTQ